MKLANILYMLICMINVGLFVNSAAHSQVWFMMVFGFISIFTFLGGCMRWDK